MEKKKMDKKFIIIRNAIIFVAIWNVVIFFFRKPYQFDFISYVLIPAVIAAILTHWDLRQKEVVDLLVDDPSKRKNEKKWDPYNHD